MYSEALGLSLLIGKSDPAYAPFSMISYTIVKVHFKIRFPFSGRKA